MVSVGCDSFTTFVAFSFRMIPRPNDRYGHTCQKKTPKAALRLITSRPVLTDTGNLRRPMCNFRGDILPMSRIMILEGFILKRFGPGCQGPSLPKQFFDTAPPPVRVCPCSGARGVHFRPIFTQSRLPARCVLRSLAARFAARNFAAWLSFRARR